MASRESTVGAVCYLGFQSTVEIHHDYTCHSVRYVLFLHIVNLVNLVNLRNYLWKNKNLAKTATCRFFFNKYALRRVHGRPPVPVLHLLQGALWPWRWMQMSVSYGGGSKTGHSDGWRHHTPKNEEAIRDGPKHAEQKEGPQIGGANMVCLRFHVNKYIKYRLDSFYINISMQFR